jgi:hypothetical protein
LHQRFAQHMPYCELVEYIRISLSEIGDHQVVIDDALNNLAGYNPGLINFLCTNGPGAACCHSGLYDMYEDLVGSFVLSVQRHSPERHQHTAKGL